MIGPIRKRARRAARDSGFTLIEVLVSLVLLSLLLALLTGAVRYARATWDAGARLDREAGYDALAFVRTRLGEAVALFEPAEAGTVRLNFSGAPESLSFVAPAQYGPAGAGLYRYAIEFVPAQAGGASGSLVVRASPYRPRQGGRDAEPPPETHVLADKVHSVVFRYFGRKDLRAAPQWQPTWNRADALPDLVEMTLLYAHRDAPVRAVVELTLRRRL